MSRWAGPPAQGWWSGGRGGTSSWSRLLVSPLWEGQSQKKKDLKGQMIPREFQRGGFSWRVSLFPGVSRHLWSCDQPAHATCSQSQTHIISSLFFFNVPSSFCILSFWEHNQVTFSDAVKTKPNTILKEPEKRTNFLCFEISCMRAYHVLLLKIKKPHPVAFII